MRFLIGRKKELRFILDVCLGKNPRVKDDLNWQATLKICGNEGLLPLFYLKLKESEDLALLPENIKKSLENEYYVLAARNSVFFDAGQELVSRLRQAGIKVLPLKGFFLNEKVYGNIAARPLADIDVLVKKSDLESADQVIKQSGWKAVHDWREFIGKPLSLNSCLYLKKSGDYIVALHLHWHLVNSTWPLGKLAQAIDMDKIWQRASDDGLSVQDQISYLSLHGVTHQFDKIILVLDIIKAVDFYSSSIRFDSEVFDLKYLKPLAWYSAGMCEYVGREPLFFYKPSGFDYLAYKKGKAGKRSYWLSLWILYSLQGDFSDKSDFIRQLLVPDAEVLAHSFQIPVSAVNYRHYLKRLFGR